MSSKKNRKRRIIGISLILALILVFTGLYFTKNNEDKYIENILKTDSYNYLSNTTKEYIKEVYAETGEVVRTEKNKEKDKLYLNPQFIKYLNMSSEEKKQVSIIPNTYITDYSIDDKIAKENKTFPAKYTWKDVDGKNYLTPPNDQQNTGLCWAFSSIENIETLLMLQNNIPYNEHSQSFSVRQLDYATAKDGMVYNRAKATSSTTWPNVDGYRELKTGGNITFANYIMANGMSLVDKSILPWNQDSTKYHPSQVINYDNSLYELNSSELIPAIPISDENNTELINNFNAKLKEKIMSYGGLTIVTLVSDECSFKSNNDPMIKVDSCSGGNINHAMQIIGWDDNYKYSYCDDNGNYKNSQNNTCAAGEYVEGQGAWIIRNSWANSPYVYATYDSVNLTIEYATDISSMKDRNWDNNYHISPVHGVSSEENKVLLSTVSIQTETFKDKIIEPEKLEKVKFINSSENATYNLSINSNGKEYKNVATATIPAFGIYTFDLSSQNIILEKGDFSITLEGTPESSFWKDSISVFTSNINKEPALRTFYGNKTYSPDEEEHPSKKNPIYIEVDEDGDFELKHLTKSIPVGAKINYRIKSNEKDYTNYLLSADNSFNTEVLNGYIYMNPALVAAKNKDKAICGKNLTLEVSYKNKILEELPIKVICTNQVTSSNINFHANNGTDYYSTIAKPDLGDIRLVNPKGTNESIGDASKFFDKDKYISGWNTQPDGLGNSYYKNFFTLYGDLDLYAEWDSPHTYKVVYNNLDSTFKEETVNYNKEYTITEELPTNPDTTQKFIHWKKDQDTYYGGEKENNLVTEKSPYNDKKVTLTAIWSDKYNTITFDSNKGNGTMKSINVLPNTDSKLKHNIFTRENYKFNFWNTESDGTGTTYQETDLINTDKDITLYAQWNPIKIIVTFNPNDGTDKTKTQEFTYGKEANLNENTFKRTGYTFKEWKTEANGDGTSYKDKGSINPKQDITLYAQWEPIKTKITLNSNDGTNTIKTQEFIYDEEINLLNEPFTRKGYTFKGWNTKDDGTGKSYNNKEVIKNNLEDITLYAIWEPITTTITFNSNDGTNKTETQKFIYDQEKTLLANPFIKEGYTFKEWNAKDDGTGKSYSNKQVIKDNLEDITLYAIWEPIKTKITLNSNDGTNTIKTQEFIYDEEINLLNEPFTRKGYTFKGWNTKDDGTGKSYNNKEVIKNNLEDITLYAIWEKIPIYKINNYSLDEVNNYISGINPNTTLEEYKKNIALSDNYNIIVDTTKEKRIYTGSKTKIYKDKELFIEFTNIVSGDVNGNGKIEIIDYIRIMKDIMNITKLNGVYYEAADMNKNNKIDIIDYIKIMKIIMEENK